jgi:hypothetical protein
MLIVGVPERVGSDELEERLRRVGADLGLEAVTVNRVD